MVWAAHPHQRLWGIPFPLIKEATLGSGDGAVVLALSPSPHTNVAQV